MNVGDRLLNYEILAQLGEGGFGEVYLARDVNLDINVAIKVLRAEISHRGTMLHRLKVGARASARLKHPNIQTVHYLGRDPATQIDFVVIEYLPGGTLRQRISLRPLPMHEALATFATICDAVDFAHRHGVIHRDLKPDNVMYDEGGRLVVTDFDLARITGQARQTTAGQAMGTLRYISPEQARGDDINHATDLYSLGVMLFELMTGRWPFMSQDPLEIYQAHLNQLPPLPSQFNPNIPAHIDQAVQRALAKSPAERHESAWQLGCAATNRPYAPRAKPVVESDPAPTPLPDTLYVRRNAFLRNLNGPNTGQRCAVGKGVSIGYGRRKNDIHVEDDYASRAHARVDWGEAGYTIMDLRSSNGTKVNGQKMDPYTPAPLMAGDQIEIGNTLLVLELE